MEKNHISRFSEIADLSLINAGDIDVLCEAINIATPADEYRAIALSTAHISQKDSEYLTSISTGWNRDNLVMSRGYGFFIKLTDDPESFICDHETHISVELKELIRWAFREGYQLIELDCDAEPRPNFPTFNW